MWMPVKEAAIMLDRSPTTYYAGAWTDRQKGRTDRYKYVGRALYVNIASLKTLEYAEYNNKEIAERLNLTVDQVRESYESGMRKLRAAINQQLKEECI